MDHIRTGQAAQAHNDNGLRTDDDSTTSPLLLAIYVRTTHVGPQRRAPFSSVDARPMTKMRKLMLLA